MQGRTGIRGLGLVFFLALASVFLIGAQEKDKAKSGFIRSNELSTMGTLREMVNQMSAWKQGDRDRNGVNDYWVLDVSSMYRVEAPSRPGEPLSFIINDAARADANPAETKGLIYAVNPAPVGSVNILGFKETLGTDKPIPKAGYFYKAIPNKADGKPYAELHGTAVVAATNVNHFGFTAYPAEYKKTGVHTFIINESGVVYKKDNVGKAVEQYPADLKKEGWIDIDAQPVEDRDQKTPATCKNMLKELHRGVIVYMAKYGGKLYEPPSETGSDLWKKISTDPTNIFKGALLDVRNCPAVEKHHPNGDYRGPAKPWSDLPQDAFVACDRQENHPDGTIHAVRKDARIEVLKKGDPDYEKALKGTSD